MLLLLSLQDRWSCTIKAFDDDSLRGTLHNCFLQSKPKTSGHGAKRQTSIGNSGLLGALIKEARGQNSRRLPERVAMTPDWLTRCKHLMFEGEKREEA